MPAVRKVRPAALVTAVACSTLTACKAVGPDFERPHARWLEDWRDSSITTATTGLPTPDKPPRDDWWRNFNDSTLDRLIDEAQRQNPSVRTAGLRIMEARAQLGIARSGSYPQVQQLTSDALLIGQDRSDGPSTSGESYSAGFLVGWEIDFWGRFRPAIEMHCLCSTGRTDACWPCICSRVAPAMSRRRRRFCRGSR